MNNLNIANLKNNKDEILKAEIGSLLFNLGKTHSGINHLKKYFPSAEQLFPNYKKYYNDNYFENDLVNEGFKLKNFIFGKKVKLPNNYKLDWVEFFKGTASSNDFIKKIFSRGCENINSGIDKGSPSVQLNNLWVSNAFGSFKRNVEEKYFDKTRYCFFERLHRFLEDNYYYSNPNWQEIRNWILNEIKSWYSRLLSDTRFPVNDVTLFDQAYMTASMFKSTLSGMFLDSLELKSSMHNEYLNNPQLIKWSILGIQYDKLALTEKGLKPASIKWYRDKTNEADKEIKNLIEINYALGNEVYRDETGIYFVVAENIIDKSNKIDDFYKLHSDLSELKEKILKIFDDTFEGEIYPTILLTEPSRGLMNLGYLIEKAKENFLKFEYSNNFPSNLNHDPNPNGICQICKMRLANKKNKDNLICDICKERLEGRTDYWLDNISDETIWLDELQDKNGRVALVTLKFELEKWINGDLINSIVQNYGKFRISLLMKKTLFAISILSTEKAFNIDTFKSIDDKCKFLLKIEKIISDICDSSLNGKIGKLDLRINFSNNTVELLDKKNNRQPLNNLINNKKFISYIKLYDFSIFNILSKDAYNGCKKNNETFDDYIRQIFFSVIRGNIWENFIKNSILNSAINWENEKIYWNNLTNNQIEFLSQILLQFLLRKNPSPARLRRIWESTREFFEDIEKDGIDELAKIPKARQKRLIITLKNNSHAKNVEYRWKELLFIEHQNQLILISSIEKLANYLNKDLCSFENLNTNEDLKKELKKIFEEKIKKLEPFENKNEENSIIDFKKNTIENIEIKDYKACFTILSPTPISWQFIIPAENLPALIENVQKKYYENFKWVYGKLPLHIGIVVQNYKSPLYVGIKALRKIRRDNVEWKNLGKEISVKDFKVRQKEASYYQKDFENNERCEDFYSLFEKVDSEGKYEFYLYPETGKKVWIDTTENSDDSDRFKFYPNTIDFEFLDSNARRNDIYYKDGKRINKWKKLRPFDLNDWQYFNEFKKFFYSDKNSASKLQKLVAIIYSKLEDWDDNESIQKFMISAFQNILELKKDKEKDEFAKIFGIGKFDDLENMEPELFKNKLLMMVDIFEFWHTILKV